MTARPTPWEPLHWADVTAQPASPTLALGGRAHSPSWRCSHTLPLLGPGEGQGTSHQRLGELRPPTVPSLRPARPQIQSSGRFLLGQTQGEGPHHLLPTTPFY